MCVSSLNFKSWQTERTLNKNVSGFAHTDNYRIFFLVPKKNLYAPIRDTSTRG